MAKPLNLELSTSKTHTSIEPLPCYLLWLPLEKAKKRRQPTLFPPIDSHFASHYNYTFLLISFHSHSFHAYVFLPHSITFHSWILMETIELKVEMVAIHEKRLRRCLSRIKGIEKVEVEASIQKVVVTGYAHRNKIMKALRKVGLRAEFWSPQNEMLSAYASGSLRINNFSFF